MTMQMALVLVALFFCISYISILVLYHIGWKEIPDFKFDNKALDNAVFISIIVPARNEEKNIVALMEALLSQSYSKEKYEIIVIDDHSTDHTRQMIEALNNNQIKIIDLKQRLHPTEINSYKKKAIEIGVTEAKGKLIVTTDADCVMGRNWLSTIAAFFQEFQPKMIVMPVLMQSGRSLLGWFQCLDFICLQGITGAAVYKRWHGMGNGANLAYTKQAFETINGYESVDHIASGDDYFLIQKMKKKFRGDVYYLKSNEAIVSTKPETSLSGFLKQRIRWASKANKYSDKSLFPVLLLVYLFNLSMAMLLVFAIVNPVSISFFNTLSLTSLEIFFYFLLLKTTVELFFLYRVAKFFNKTTLLFAFPFFQPFHIVYTIVSGLFGAFGKYEWKGRRVK